MKQELRANLVLWGAILAAALAAGACRKTDSAIVKGAQVRMRYTLTVDGKVASRSVKEPFVFVQGSGRVVPGVEEQLEGLKSGAKKSFVVPPEKGYGLVDPAAIEKVPATAFPDLRGARVGRTVYVTHEGRKYAAKIKSVGKKEVVLDVNHPLAGKTLKFDIEVVGVEAP